MGLRASVEFAAVVPILFGAAVAFAQNTAVPRFPMDTPMSMRAVEAVCTGIGTDARNDPRWAAYPLKIEIVGRGGQFLGDSLVTVEKDGDALASVNCGGPWVLFRVPPGAYGISAEMEGMSQMARVTVGATGQSRVVLRFAEAGGAVSPEYVPPR